MLALFQRAGHLSSSLRLLTTLLFALIALGAGRVSHSQMMTNPVICGFVKNDVNCSLTTNSSLDPSTLGGIAGASVTLTDAGGHTTKTTTDANGFYVFSKPATGVYMLSVSYPNGYVAEGVVFRDDLFALPFGAAGNSTSATNVANIVYDGTSAYDNYDFLACPAAKAGTIKGIVNDCYTPSKGYAGVVVTLTDALGNTVATTTTDANGNYSFTAPAGTYSVSVPNSVTAANGTVNIGVTGVQIATTVAAGKTVTVNFCYNSKVTKNICGVVYCDDNNNSIQDGGEPGLPYVTVKLINSAHMVIATTVTDSQGNYSFSGIAAGTYWVQVPKVANGLLVYGYSDTTVVVNGQCTTKNFRYYGGAISGYAFYDWSYNGKKDCWDQGLPYVTITLKDSQGNVVDTQCTDCNGFYCFSTCLPAGCYTVSADTSLSYCSFIRLDTCYKLNVCICPGQTSSDHNFGYAWQWCY